MILKFDEFTCSFIIIPAGLGVGAIVGIVVVALVVVILLVAVIIIMVVVWRRRQSGEFVVVHWRFLVFFGNFEVKKNFGVHFGCKVLPELTKRGLKSITSAVEV